MEKFIIKAKAWVKTAGFRSLGYLGTAVAAKVILGSEILAGVGIGVFVSDNWVTIKSLISKKIQELK